MSTSEKTPSGRLIRTWPEPDDLWATMLIVHGLGEHSGRYEHVGDQLVEAGIAVRSFDLTGFGGSDGERAYVSGIDVYLEEIAAELEASAKPGVPSVLLGHSMGGLLAYRYALSGAPAPDYLVLSSPAFGSSTAAIKRIAAPWIAKVAPKLAVPSDISGDMLSRDPAVGEAYFADPLVLTKTTTGLGAVLLEAIASSSDMAAPPMPTYVFHGGADTLVPAKVSAALGERTGVERRLYPKLRHETMNEPEGPEVVSDVIAWLRNQINS